MLSTKKWKPVTYTVGSHAIAMKIRRLKPTEAAELRAASIDAYTASGLNDVHELPPDSTLEEIEERSRALARARAKFLAGTPPELIERFFADYVKDVEGVEDEDGPVTTGPGLYQVADGELVMFVLSALRTHSSLTDEEGKGSGSSSTSVAPPRTADTSSAAPSTGVEGGPESSTATETPSGV